MSKSIYLKKQDGVTAVIDPLEIEIIGVKIKDIISDKERISRELSLYQQEYEMVKEKVLDMVNDLTGTRTNEIGVGIQVMFSGNFIHPNNNYRIARIDEFGYIKSYEEITGFQLIDDDVDVPSDITLGYYKVINKVPYKDKQKEIIERKRRILL